MHLLRYRHCIGLVLIVSVGGPAFAQRWWDNDWPRRVELRLDELKPTGLDGQEVAVATFRHDGSMNAKGEDLRIVDARANEPVPHRILQIGPGDLVTVAFAAPPGRNVFHAYFGNPHATAAARAKAADTARSAAGSAQSKAKTAKAEQAKRQKAFDAARKRAETTAAALADARKARQNAVRARDDANRAKDNAAAARAKANTALDAARAAEQNARKRAASTQPTDGDDAVQAATAAVARAKTAAGDADKTLRTATDAAAKAQAALPPIEKKLAEARQADQVAQAALADARTKLQAAQEGARSASTAAQTAGDLARRLAAAANPLDIRRGVLLEIWERPGGNANNWKEAEAVVAKRNRRRKLGAAMRGRIGAGHNPFADNSNLLAIWTGWFIAPSDGDYEFGLSSRNASFLRVDDKNVVANGRWHGPSRRIQRAGTIKLTKGLHRLEAWHISGWSDPILAVAWKPPGKQWAPIPPGAYTEVHEAIGGVVEQRGRSVNADFSVGEGGEVFLENRYFQRRELRARVGGRGTGGATFVWDFGDGQRATTKTPDVEHVYLANGTMNVRLEIQGLGTPLTATHQVHVDRDWDAVTRRDLERIGQYVRIVRDYDLAKLPPRENYHAALLFRRAKAQRPLEIACEVFARRKDAPADVVERMIPICLDQIPGDQQARAVALCEHAATMTDKPEVSSRMRNRAARLALERAGAPQKALAIFQSVRKDFADSSAKAELRDAHIGVGDCWRAAGEADKAKAAYDQAGIVDKRAKSFPAIVRGDFARRAEDFLRRKEVEAAGEVLDDWDRTMPADRLEGYSTLLRVRWLMARKQFARAAAEAETLVKVNPTSQYAPDLLLLAAEAYIQAKDGPRAVRALERVVRTYPESPKSLEAAKLLEASK